MERGIVLTNTTRRGERRWRTKGDDESNDEYDEDKDSRSRESGRRWREQ